MVFVPPIEIIGDSEKYYAALEGCLAVSGLDFFEKGKRLDRLLGKHDDVLLFLDAGRGRHFQEKNNIYNRQVLEEILDHGIMHKRVLFMTGVSPDLTPEGAGIPQKYGIDPMADIHALSTRILERAARLPGAYEDILFFPIAPVLWPFFIEDDAGTLRVVHALPEIARGVHEEMVAKEKRGYGRLEKTLSDAGGEVSWQFHPHAMLFEDLWYEAQRSPSEYHELLGRTIPEKKDILRLEASYNRILMENVFLAVVKGLCLDEIVHYSLKGSYSYKIMEKVAKHAGIPLKMIGDSGPLAKNKITVMAEVDPSCLSALDGDVRAQYFHGRGEKPIPLKREPVNPRKGLDLKNCPYEEAIMCSHQSKCDEFRNPCAMNHFRSIEASTHIRKDAKAHYYGLYEGIEAVISDLLRDHPVFTVASQNFSWEEERKDISPLILPNRQELLNLEGKTVPDLRASGLGGRCVLSTLISLYSERLHDLMGESAPEENDLAKIGTGIHSFLLDQYAEGGAFKEFAPNNIWRKLGKSVVFRNEYTEQYVPYTYVGADNAKRIISGHVDCPIIIDGKNIGVIDVKRSRRIPYPKWEYRFQLLTYALGLREHSGLNPDSFYLILVNRPFDEETGVRHIQQEGLYKLQQITIMKVDAHKDLLQEKLYERYELLLAEKERLMSSNAYVLERKAEKIAEGECDSCGGFLPDLRSYCDFLAGHCIECKNVKEMLK